jgi:hypothetical protein
LKQDNPSLCGLGHEDYAKKLLEITRAAIAKAEGGAS